MLALATSKIIIGGSVCRFSRGIEIACASPPLDDQWRTTGVLPNFLRMISSAASPSRSRCIR